MLGKGITLLVSMLFVAVLNAQSLSFLTPEFFDPGDKDKFNDLISNSCMSDLNTDAILEKYWKLREDLNNEFIYYSSEDLLNLENDGIGEFNFVNLQDDDPHNDVEKCLFQFSGYNLPANSYDVNGDGFTRGFGDTGIRIGQLIANTCMEYSLFKKIGDNENTQIALNKIFLQLQAIRRLDMLANKWMEIFYSECNDECPDFVADLSGFTGFMLRDDVDFTFKTDTEDSSFNVTGTSSDFVRKWNDIINAQLGEDISNPNPEDHCNRVCFFPSFTHSEFEGDINNVISQDQLIGILQGLVYVKRFVPESATVMVGNESHNVFDIAFNIALGIKEITNACSNRIKYPGCHDCDDLENVPRGSDLFAYYYGIANTVEYITGIPANTTWSENLGWASAGGFTSGIGGRKVNIRMYNKLSVYGDVNTNSETIEDAIHTGNIVTPLELILLHGNYDAFNTDFNAFDGDASKEWRDKYCELITSLSCDGPCNFEGEINGVECESNDLWCSGQPLEYNGPDLEIDWSDFPNPAVVDHCPDQQAIYSPLEYLYMVSLLLVTDVLDVDFVDPSAIDSELDDGLFISGPTVICENDIVQFTFTTEIPFGDFEFCASDNFEIIDVNENKVTVELVDYSVKEGVICIQEIIDNNDDCAIARRINKKVSITEDVEVFYGDLHLSTDPCTKTIEILNDGLINDQFIIQDINFIGVNGPLGEIYAPNSTGGNTFSFYYHPNTEIPSELDAMATIIEYEVTFTVPCLGEQSFTGRVDFTECIDWWIQFRAINGNGYQSDEDVLITLSPNPIDISQVGNVLNVNITDQDAGVVKGVLYLAPSNSGQIVYVKEIDSSVSSWDGVIDLDVNINNGIGYVIFLRSDGVTFHSPFVVERR